MELFMNGNELMSWYKTKLREVKSNYTLALVKDVDGVHDMRVALKRMKAFFNLLGAISDDFDAKKRFRHFKKLARNSGAIRDAQVQIELLADINKPLGLDVTSYRDFLLSHEEKGFKELLVFAESDPIGKLKGVKKTISRALDDSTSVRVETMAQGRFYNLRNNLVLAGREQLEETVLHTIRILSKEIHYTFEILYQCLHLFEGRDDFVPEIKKVHQVLGKWHDYDVSLEYLDAFFTGNGVSPTDEPYSLLVKSVRKEKQRLHKKFSSVVKRFNDVAVTL